MKDTIFSDRNKEIIYQQIQKQVIKQKIFLGTLRPKPGQFVWEFNMKKGTIEKAEIDTVALKLKGDKILEINAKENCLYCVALNKDNAETKFFKLFKL